MMLRAFTRPERFRGGESRLVGGVLILALLGGAAWFAGGVLQAAFRERVEVGQRAPDFTASTLDGAAIALSELEGRVVLLDFFSLHCVGCVGATPRHNRLARRLGDRGMVLGVNLDPEEEAGQVAAYIDNRPVDYPVILDPEGRLADAFGVGSLPTEIVIGPNARVHSVHHGLTSEAAMERELIGLAEPSR